MNNYSKILNNKNNIQVIGFDLDKTLLRDDKTISEFTENTIKAASDNGIYIIPITGRPYSGIPECVTNLNGIDYAITTNGANIFDLKNNQIVYSSLIDYDTTISLIEELDAMDCKIEGFYNGCGYETQDVMDNHLKMFGGTSFCKYIIQSRKVIDNVKAFFLDGKKCAEEFFVIFDSRDQRDSFAKQIEMNDKLQAFALEDKYLEITSIQTSKGNALKEFCKSKNIDIQNTIAFGDGQNDIPLLTEAGVSVAVSNAVNELKELADIVTTSNNEDGVAKIINMLL